MREHWFKYFSNTFSENDLSDAIWALSKVYEDFKQQFFEFSFSETIEKVKDITVYSIEREYYVDGGFHDFAFITSDGEYFLENKITDTKLKIISYLPPGKNLRLAYILAFDDLKYTLKDSGTLKINCRNGLMDVKYCGKSYKIYYRLWKDLLDKVVGQPAKILNNILPHCCMQIKYEVGTSKHLEPFYKIELQKYISNKCTDSKYGYDGFWLKPKKDKIWFGLKEFSFSEPKLYFSIEKRSFYSRLSKIRQINLKFLKPIGFLGYDYYFELKDVSDIKGAYKEFLDFFGYSTQ